LKWKFMKWSIKSNKKDQGVGSLQTGWTLSQPNQKAERIKVYKKDGSREGYYKRFIWNSEDH
jgi:hypothetical protein